MRVLVMILCARVAAAQPALEPKPVMLTPALSTVPVRLVRGSVVGQGSASFDLGTSRFVIHVKAAAPYFEGRLELAASYDAAEAGVEIERAHVETIGNRIVIVPRARPNPLHELVLIELAYVAWAGQATRLAFYSDASGGELARWQQLAKKIVVATEAEPAYSIEHVGPFVIELPRGVRALHHATFDELTARDESCEVEPLAWPVVAPPDAIDLREHDYDVQRFLWADGQRIHIEVAMDGPQVRVHCSSLDEHSLKSLLQLVYSGRWAPRWPALERIRKLLQSS